MEPRVRLPLALAGLVVVAVAVSAIRPKSYGTWLLEVAPILIALPLLALTYRRFPLTRLAYWLIFAHALVLALGGHYTYAEVPLGDLPWTDRNHYDRFAHFVQGFVPAVLVREILLRRSPLRPGRWTFFLVSATCLAISAGYEFIEWAGAITGGESATDFLGTQGDVWDTHWDMLLALVGSVVAQWVLARPHDRQLAELSVR
jgi:putative membrane protein